MAPKKEKKIFFEAEDGLEVVLKAIQDANVPRVILNFPKNSEAADDIESFHEMKQKAEKLEKEVLVESVDDHILEFASLAGIAAVNPVFRSRERAISDIVVRPKSKKRVAEKAEESKQVIKARKQESQEQKTKEQTEKENEIEEAEENSRDDRLKSVLTTIQARKESRGPYESHERAKVRRELHGKLWYITRWALAAVALAGIYFTAFYILPEARITLTLKRAERQFSDKLFVSTKASAWTIDQSGAITLPGQLLSATKNAQVPIEAQGKRQVNEKAKGKLIIYNGYNKNPQQLVATTRFESPDGKIFRLDKAVVVPGAKVEGGKITPSSVEAEVTAAEAGDASNVGPQMGWKLPAFKGTPRYDGFYAENKERMQGGFVGERPSATEEDMKAGEAKLANVLENALSAQMSILLSEKFKLIDGATSFALTRVELQSDPQNPDKAFLYGEASMKKLVFIEEMLSAALMEKYRDSAPENAKVETLRANYAPPTVNFTDGTMEVSAEGAVSFVSDISPERVREGVAGKNEAELKQFVFSLPGVEGAKISLWPFWVVRAPKNADRIDVSIK